MFRLLPLLSVLLTLLPFASPCLTHAPAPATAAKLRRLLPFPDATLRQTMDLSIGLKNAPNHGTVFFRYGYTDDITQIIVLRRTLTGGTADAPRYLSLGWLYRQAGLSAKAQAAFRQSQALYDVALQRRPHDGMALAGHGRTLQASGQTAAAEAYFRKATQIAPNSADVWMAYGSVLAAQATPRTEAAHPLVRQAAAAYNRAVSLAPQNPKTWTAQGDFRTFTQPDLLGKSPSAAGLSDYEKAATLSPDDPYAQIQVPETEHFAIETAHHIFTSLETAKVAPRSFNLRAKESLRQLTRIAQAHHGQRSAAAYKARA